MTGNNPLSLFQAFEVAKLAQELPFSFSIKSSMVRAHRTDIKFQTEHLIKYGLSVIERDVRTMEVCAVRCQFCVFFDREEVVGQKRERQQTEHIKDFKSFSPELYRKHLQGQHLTLWGAYEKLSQVEKASYFNEKVQHKATISGHFGQKMQAHDVYNVDAEIVDKVIDEMFFHSDEKGNIDCVLHFNEKVLSVVLMQ